MRSALRLAGLAGIVVALAATCSAEPLPAQSPNVPAPIAAAAPHDVAQVAHLLQRLPQLEIRRLVQAQGVAAGPVQHQVHQLLALEPGGQHVPWLVSCVDVDPDPCAVLAAKTLSLIAHQRSLVTAARTSRPALLRT